MNQPGAHADGANDATAAFHREAMALLATHGDTPMTRAAIGDRLQRLATQPGVLTDELIAMLARLHDAGSTATILHEGPDGRGALMLLRLPAEAPTPIHNHNSWGVACVIRGRNRYWRWERRDDLSDPNRADLALIETFEHGPGELAAWPDPPQDLHAQQGVGDAVYEFVFFGRNPNLAPRAYFDPETGAVTYAMAADDPVDEMTAVMEGR